MHHQYSTIYIIKIIIMKNNRNGCVIRIYTTRKYWTIDGDSTGLKVTITLLTKNVHETNKNSSLNKSTRL